MGSVQQTRPTGVTILAVIQIIASVAGLLAGLGIIALAGIIGLMGEGLIPVIGALQGMESFLGGFFFGLVGISLIVLGAFGFVLAWGLWTGKSWAWTITIITTIISIISDLLTLPGGIVGLILSGLILYYLTRPAVKGYFGKSPVNVTV